MADPGEEPDLAAIEQELHDVVAQVLGRHDLMVTKWMMVVEGIDSAGERAFEAFTSPDFRAWDSIGFLGFLDARERGVIGAEAARERSEDDR